MNVIILSKRRSMKRISFLALICGLGALVVVSPSTCADASENGTDIVLAVDTSDSMKKTDPHNLRVEAARLFIHLLDDDDRLALVTFDTTTRVLANLTGIGEGHAVLLSQIRKPGSPWTCRTDGA